MAMKRGSLTQELKKFKKISRRVLKSDVKTIQ